MSKILITNLGGIRSADKGTKSYRTTNYSIEGKVYDDKKLIFSALDEHYKYDKIVILGTAASMWDEFYEYLCNVKELPFSDEKYLEINEECSSATSKTDISTIKLQPIVDILANDDKYQIEIIKFGASEEEMIENLNTLIELTDSFDNDSDISLDLTHGFRSNAFYMFMVMNYINDVKNFSFDNKLETRIDGIFYGMSELNNTKERKEGDKEITPVLNLKVFSELSTLLKGVHEIAAYGNFYTIANQMDDTKIKNKLIEFSDALNANYIGDVKNKIQELSKILDTVKTMDNSLIKMILPKTLEKFISRFSGIKSDHMFLLEISKWYGEQKKYAASYLIMRESIIRFFGDNYSEKMSEADLENEEKTTERKLAQLQWTKKVKEKHPGHYESLIELGKISEKCRKIRNCIAHSGEGLKSLKNDIQNIPHYISKLEKLFKDKKLSEYIKTANF